MVYHEDKVAIAIELKPQWHIYWENPGDTGLETSVEHGKLIFPPPHSSSGPEI